MFVTIETTHTVHHPLFSTSLRTVWGVGYIHPSGKVDVVTPLCTATKGQTDSVTLKLREANPPLGDESVRIVNADNRGSEYDVETFVTAAIPESVAEVIADEMNEQAGEHSPRYYKVVPVGYTLRNETFEP